MSLVHQAEVAIQGFYHCSDSVERNTYHRWLLDLQQSPEAWTVSWMLLDSSKSVECQYYGAVILHFKIRHMISEVSETDLQELKTKLLSMIASFKSGLKLVLGKLCSTFSALIIQTANEEFQLGNCLQEVETFINSSGIGMQDVIVKLLTEFPAQFKAIDMNSHRKMLVRSFMNEFKPKLVVTCQSVLQNKESEFHVEILACLLGWVEFGVSIIECIDIFPLLLAHIECEETSEKICEVLSELMTSPSSYSLHSTVFDVLNKLLPLQSMLEKAKSEENHLLLENICKLFCNIGETHCNMLIRVKDNMEQLTVFNFIKIILSFSSMPGNYPVDENCSNLTLNFWYSVQDELFTLDVDELSDYQTKFHEAFLLLIDIYYLKVQYPSDDVYNKYSSEEKEQFRCYRIDVQDTIMYLHNTLRERCFQYFTETLKSLIKDSSTRWQQFEALLYLLTGICGMLDIEEEQYIPNLISLMASVPSHNKVKNALVAFIGGLGEWLNHHPSHIPQVLPYLLSGILNNETNSSCSLSLNNICQECAKLLDEPSIELILNTCHQALKHQPTKVMVRLIETCGYVMSVLPVEQMNNQLQRFVAPLLQNLKHSLETKYPVVISIEKISQYLSCIHGLYRSLDPYEVLAVHPITHVYAQMIQIFPLLKSWCNVEKVIVAATNCICKALEIVRENLIEYIGVTCELLYDFFTTNALSCILETSALLIRMFGTEEKTVEMTKNFFIMLVRQGLSLIDNGNKYTDCMQGLMYLLSKTIRTVPEFVYSDVDRQVAILKCSLVLLTFQETPTVKSTCDFIVTYINYSSVYESSKELLRSFGRELVVQVLLCIGDTAPRHLTDCYAEILLTLNKNNVTQLAVWLKDVFSTENFPTKYPTCLQKEYFQKALLREKASKSRTKQTVKDFALVCRGLHTMPYTS